MNTVVTHNGVMIDLLLDEEPTMLQDKGWVHKAIVLSDSTRDEVGLLVGLKLWGDPIMWVESFAVEGQKNKTIGLLLGKKKW